MIIQHLRRLRAAGTIAMLVAMAAAVVGCSAGGTKNSQSSSEGDASGPVIRTGWQPLIQWAHIGNLPSYADGFQVKLSPFKTSNDTLVAMGAGSLDLGGMGYNQAAAAMARGKFPYTFVAGASSGASPSSRATVLRSTPMRICAASASAGPAAPRRPRSSSRRSRSTGSTWTGT
jgi:ABC-type nitrate/sulfonate/bicarbonate transport system substrate-binding protein